MKNGIVTLSAVGDIALGDHPLCTGFGTHSRSRTKPAGFPFERVASLLRGREVVFGNLECTLSEVGVHRGDLSSTQMRGHAAYLSGLQESGFNVVNVANNHALQHGRAAFEDSVSMLQKAGIAVCGLAGEHYTTSVPTVLERNGLRIAFLGYSLRPRQYFVEEPLYAEGYRENILADVRTARATYDCVVVSLHWGDEFIQRPSADERHLAHEIMDAGSDLIIGHHPHVLRGIERYGRGFIVYSLGNFVCDMLWDRTLRQTVILNCDLTSHGATNLRLVPIEINDEYQPTPLEGPEADRLRADIDTLSNQITAGVTGESAQDYGQAADSAHRRVRRQSHTYFLRKIYRFPPKILAQQLATFARNRLAELRGKAAAEPPNC